MMSRRVVGCLALPLGLALLLAQLNAVPLNTFPSRTSHTPAVPPTQHAAIASRYGQLPLSFEVNAGQDTDPAVRFLAHGSGYTLALTPAQAVLALEQPPSRAAQPDQFRLPGQTVAKPVAPSIVVGMQWLGANPDLVITGEQPLPGIVNYFLGNDPAQWHTNIATYQRVRLHDIYPGVDLVYYGNKGQLEYDFVVEPGSNPAAIHLGFSGADRLGTDLAGNLSLTLLGGTIAQAKPLVYQTVNGARQPIAGGFALAGGGRVGFALGAYDPHLPLVIDPVYRFSTYLGGNGFDQGNAITVDSGGNAYVTGYTQSINFPTVSGSFDTTIVGSTDAFVSKVNAAGTALVYSTYLGGSAFDTGQAIAVDASGNVYVEGYTQSTDFFTTLGAFDRTFGGDDDVFVTKLNAAGNAAYYSTYLGGSNFDDGYGLAVDSGGNAYVTGYTASTDFPTTGGAFQTSPGSPGLADVFVSKLNASGSALVYSTYLGGSSSDVGNGIAVDASGNAYVTGSTQSTNFPLVASGSLGGVEDAFVTKLNAAGSLLIYSTYLGGSGDDLGTGLAVDSGGNAYVTGVTQSTNFPTTPPGETLAGMSDAFVSKLNATGISLVYSTLLGGSSLDSGAGIAVDRTGDAYVTGFTTSTDFPLASPLRSVLHGTSDVFVTKLDTSGSVLLFSTYLGGNENGGEAGTGIAAGTGGAVYVVGYTSATDFPTANALFPAFAGGQYDAFITKIQTLPTPVFTPGVFRSSNATFYLHNSNTSGVADESAAFGAGTDVPVAGDWTGKGYKSIGVFRNGTWYLRNSNTTGGADITLAFGATGDIPVVGDWTGKGYDSVGIFRPSNGTFYLRNTNTTGGADIVVPFGTTGDIPVAGDWTGKGYDSIGVYRPSRGAFFLRNRNTGGMPNLTVFFGALGDTPLVGDWTGKGFDTIGVYRPSTQTFYLRNSNSTSAYADLSVVYGASGDKPLVGVWLLPLGSSKPSHGKR